MSQERWDVVLRFLDGPLSLQGDVVMRGPVVRMGANPGPGGLSLEGYRGLDSLQAVITAYDGGTVSVAPVGKNQVRVNTHEHVNWAEIQPLVGPVFLSRGDVMHLGPAGRGATVLFIEARPLRFASSAKIFSDGAQANAEHRISDVRQLSTGKGVPKWFVPAMLGMGLITVATMGSLLTDVLRPDVVLLGPVEEGELQYERVELDEAKLEVIDAQFSGFDQAFEIFVMVPNAAAAEWPALRSDRTQWDETYVKYTKLSVSSHARATRFWQAIDGAEPRYHAVIKAARAAGLPDVVGAIPYQESNYTPKAQSFVCAGGWWQLMPEVANRVDVKLRDCKLRGQPWSPTRISPPIPVIGGAPYVGSPPQCLLRDCAIDERQDFDKATEGAMKLLADAWQDPLLRSSGAAVQALILSHNAGYDNSRFHEKKVNAYNILPIYQKHLKQTAQKRDQRFYGANITCVGAKPEDLNERVNGRCGGLIANETQHYAYSITAQHILAACYYAKNYPEQEIWGQYNNQLYGDGGYCHTLNVPDRAELTKKR